MKARWAVLALCALWPAAAAAEWIDAFARSPLTPEAYASFSENLLKRETSFANTAKQACTPDGHCGFQASATSLFDSQVSVVSRALEQTLVATYRLDQWGRSILREPWDAQKVGLAALVGGTMLFVDGLRTHVQVSGWRMGLALASGRRLHEEGTRLASVDLSRSGAPLSFSASWGRLAPTFGLRYALRY